MWDPPAWWSWLWASACIVLVAAWYVDVARRRRVASPIAAAPARGDDGARGPRRAPVPVDPPTRADLQSDADQVAPSALVTSVAWQPALEPMGPVSGWPYALDAPDAPASGSPEDRPDL